MRARHSEDRNCGLSTVWASRAGRGGRTGGRHRRALPARGSAGLSGALPLCCSVPLCRAARLVLCLPAGRPHRGHAASLGDSQRRTTWTAGACASSPEDLRPLVATVSPDLMGRWRAAHLQRRGYDPEAGRDLIDGLLSVERGCCPARVMDLMPRWRPAPRAHSCSSNCGACVLGGIVHARRRHRRPKRSEGEIR